MSPVICHPVAWNLALFTCVQKAHALGCARCLCPALCVSVHVLPGLWVGMGIICGFPSDVWYLGPGARYKCANVAFGAPVSVCVQSRCKRCERILISRNRGTHSHLVLCIHVWEHSLTTSYNLTWVSSWGAWIGYQHVQEPECINIKSLAAAGRLGWG